MLHIQFSKTNIWYEVIFFSIFKAEKLGMEDNVYPGEIWGANAQCQIFLLDSDAHIDHNEADFQV